MTGISQGFSMDQMMSALPFDSFRMVTDVKRS